MIIIAFIILIISFILALKAVREELSVPHEVKKIKIKKSKEWYGAILFLKKKIIHYSSKSS